ncbi:MAG: hypothetical protein FWC92_03005 [Defluviitaleaceae bacterium]|nr:hypothetical protein [Defluviitaleaceae bacterium]
MHCLNGLWDFSCGESLSVLPSTWEDVRIIVPSPYNVNRFAQGYNKSTAGEEYHVSGGDFKLFPDYPLHWDTAKCGFYRRNIFIPEDSRGKRLFLRFDAAAFKTVFWLNNKKIAEDTEAFLPIEIEITNHVVYGKDNELIVGTEVASAMKYKDENNRNRLDYPQGSFWGDQVAGIWQDVWLLARPMEYISDVFAVTEVANNLLKVKCAYVGDDGLCIGLHLDSRQISEPVTCNNTGEITIKWNYNDGDINLWDIGCPNLYILKASLYKNGSLIDETEIRIGFRSFTASGNKFYLNGRVINLRNDSWHYMGYAVQTEEFARDYYRMARDANVNIIRLHAQPFPSFYFDIADEMGMLLVSESGIWASHCDFSYNPDFFENSKNHLRRLILRDRNHPSVVMWSPENECIPAYKVCGSKYIKDVADLQDKLYDLTTVIAPLDDSRLISCDGSGDLNGRLPINSLHYPGYDCPTHRDKPITIGEMGSMYYSTPENVCMEHGEAVLESFEGRLTAVAQDAYRNLIGQRKWAAQICVFNLLWYGLMPLPFKEQNLVYEDYTTPGIKPKRLTPYLRTINAGASKELPCYIPNPVFDFTKDAYIPTRFFVENAPVSGYSGESVEFPYVIFNDNDASLSLSIRVNLEGYGRLDTSQVYTLEPCTYAEDVIRLTMPKDITGDSKLVFELLSDESIIFSEALPFALYSRDELLKSWEDLGVVCLTGNDKADDSILSIDCRVATPYESFAMKGSHRHLFGQDTHVCLNKPTDGFYFGEYLSFGAKPLYFTGMGNAVAVSLLESGLPRILCGIDLPGAINDPEALRLMISLGRYLKDNCPVVPTPAYYYGDVESNVVAMLNEVRCAYEVIDQTKLAKLLESKQDRLLVVDGKQNLDWLKAVHTGNFANVLVIGQHKVPNLFSYDFDITGLNALHLKNSEEGRALGVYGNNLYGLGSGVEEILATNLMRYKGKTDAIILGLPDIDWRMWNHNAEYLKTVSIHKSEKADNTAFAALSRHEYAGSDIYFSQISLATQSRKVKNITTRLLSSLGCKIEMIENNDLDELLYGGMYSNRVTGMLHKRLAEGEDITALNPGLNRIENGNTWKIIRDNGGMPEGVAVVYVHSPQDRTDLLLNPDTVDMNIKAEKGVKVYLNGEAVGEGTEFSVTSVPFTPGWNNLMFYGSSQPMPDIRFKRINLKQLDLKFGVYEHDIVLANMQKANLLSQDQPNNLHDAIGEIDKCWRSSGDQRNGIDLGVEFPSATTCKAMFFTAAADNGRTIYLPYRFKIMAGDTLDSLQEVYMSRFENDMYYREGKVFIRLDDVTAKIFKLVLTDNALKPLFVSGLTFLT